MPEIPTSSEPLHSDRLEHALNVLLTMQALDKSLDPAINQLYERAIELLKTYQEQGPPDVAREAVIDIAALGDHYELGEDQLYEKLVGIGIDTNEQFFSDQARADRAHNKRLNFYRAMRALLAAGSGPNEAN